MSLYNKSLAWLFTKMVKNPFEYKVGKFNGLNFTYFLLSDTLFFEGDSVPINEKGIEECYDWIRKQESHVKTMELVYRDRATLFKGEK